MADATRSVQTPIESIAELYRRVRDLEFRTGQIAGGIPDVSGYLPLTGGTLTGPLTMEAGATIQGSDLVIDESRDIQFRSFQDAHVGSITAYSGTGREILVIAGGDTVLAADPTILLYGSSDNTTPGDTQFRDKDDAYWLRWDEANQQILFRIGGIQAVTIDDGAGVRMFGPSSTRGWQLNEGAGSGSAPVYSFRGDVDTGIYSNEANAMYFTAGGNAMLGLAQGTVNSPQINASTTTAAANVNVNGAGLRVVARSTSSLRYKPGWEFADLEALASIELPVPIVWEDRDHGPMLGWGTEHIGEALPIALQDAQESGQPENYDLRAVVAVIAAKLRLLDERVDVLATTPH